MSSFWPRRHRRSLASGAVVAGAGLVVGSGWFAQTAESQVSVPCVRVEEDWTLVLNRPDGNANSPQFHTVMSASADLEDSYAQVLWNYRETPAFTAGGVQLQSYVGERMTRSRSMEFSKLNTTAETITWTQSLSTDGTTLSFEVKNGDSLTWGQFGKDMRLDSASTLSSLEGYSPQISARNSGVTFGVNRVDVMKITQVRRYAADGTLLSVDTSPVVVREAE